MATIVGFIRATVHNLPSIYIHDLPPVDGTWDGGWVPEDCGLASELDELGYIKGAVCPNGLFQGCQLVFYITKMVMKSGSWW